MEGRVQGVFYRVSSVEKARSLGLSGWVRNLADGRVELIAHGDSAAQDALSSWLWEGPPAASVTAVTVAVTDQQPVGGFQVR